MGIYKCIVTSRHGFTLNSCRTASPFVRLVKKEEVAGPDHSMVFLPQVWRGRESSHTVTCIMLKATDNDRPHLALCHDEFLGFDRVFADHVAVVAATN
ncbi:uncharacterized protein TNCV_4308321 [Trichonephila clavipes]|nr:uncharacterized protein TNCV_4308321 [Trichonephila clavipes]